MSRTLNKQYKLNNVENNIGTMVWFPRLGVWLFSISCFLVMSEELARCINLQTGGPGDFWSRFSSSRPWQISIKLITGEKEKRMSKKNVVGRSTSSHDNKKFRTRSMNKQRGMAFGFRKTATAVKNRTDR